MIFTTMLAMLVACDKEDSVMTSSDYEYKSDVSAIATILDTTDEKYCVLVNKENIVDKEFDPGKIVKLDSGYTNGDKDVEIEENVKTVVQAMIDEMRAEGISGICVTSGYRSYAYQEWLFNYYIEDEMTKDPDLTHEEAEKIV
jgi:LAS superfamily LD-carboxypeptidase LdcB